jgi:hypothetical protein
MQIFIRPDGGAQCLYGEKIVLQTLGSLDIKRASHVEPDPDQPGNWYVDLSPVGGPVMNGFTSRADALKWEETWLNDQMTTRHVEAFG